MIVTLSRDTRLELAPGLQVDMTEEGVLKVRAVPRGRFRRFVVLPAVAMLCLGAAGYGAISALPVMVGPAEAQQASVAPVTPRAPAQVVVPPQGPRQPDPFGLD